MHLLAPTPVSQWVSGSVTDRFRFGDSYRISELCELVSLVFSQNSADIAHSPFMDKWIDSEKGQKNKLLNLERMQIRQGVQLLFHPLGGVSK